jgi:small subunit ribosomal protein S4
LTEYGTQLKEKQKAKYLYGVMERQFRRYYEKSMSQTGNTAENFLVNLERRLDNVVYRMGFAKTRAAARQLVSHGWITVNGKSVNIPSYSVRVGEVIALKPNTKGTPIGETIAKQPAQSLPSWLTVDSAALSGKVSSQPTKEDFPQNLNMTLVVEFYSR